MLGNVERSTVLTDQERSSHKCRHPLTSRQHRDISYRARVLHREGDKIAVFPIRDFHIARCQLTENTASTTRTTADTTLLLDSQLDSGIHAATDPVAGPSPFPSSSRFPRWVLYGRTAAAFHPFLESTIAGHLHPFRWTKKERTSPKGKTPGAFRHSLSAWSSRGWRWCGGILAWFVDEDGGLFVLWTVGGAKPPGGGGGYKWCEGSMYLKLNLKSRSRRSEFHGSSVHRRAYAPSLYHECDYSVR